MNRSQRNFTFLCCLVYFTSYMTRINYGATIAEIITANNITKAIAAIAVTGSFITYGVGQLVSGFLGDKIAPRYLISIGLGATSLCNLTVGLCNNMSIIIPVWCINGFAQALLWPPLVRCMTKELPHEQFKSACSLVNAASSVATIVIYLIVPICITLSGWHSVFLVCSALGIVSCSLWTFFTRNKSSCMFTEKDDIKDIPQEARNNSVWKIIVTSGLIPVMIVIILQGMLRDGITTWMPSYIKDVFGLPSSSSILTSAILPVFAILSIWFTQWFSTRNKTEIHTSAWLWGAALVSCVGLLIFLNTQMLVSALLMAIMTACMHGINLMLISNLPARFIKYGKVSFFSGVLNSCTYVGSAISTYGIALISESFGWSTTVAVWGIVALAGLLLCIYSIGKTKKLME